MSAYIVNLEHVAYLVQAGTACELGFRRSTLSWAWNIDREADTYERQTLPAGDCEQAQRVGQMLWDENIKSVQARYPRDAVAKLPGTVDCGYEYPKQGEPRFDIFDPVQVIKACDCFDYQSCEHEGWVTSEAKAYIDALRHHAWSALPGYDGAAWGAPTTTAGRYRKAREAQRATELAATKG